MLIPTPKLTQKQHDVASQLSRYDPKIQFAYLGSIHALCQEDYPDQTVHFAQSLRQVIDLLARNGQNETERNKSLERKERKRLLQSVIDPLGKQAYAYNDEYQTLVDAHNDLSSIAHHKETITNELAFNKLSVIEDILHMFTRPQTNINDEIDEILSQAPSTENAEKLKKLQFRWASQSQLIEKVPQEWLPYMITAGFFAKPPITTFEKDTPRYTYWASSKYLLKCVTDFPNEVTSIILSCTFQNSKDRNPTIYADFLTCANNLPLKNIEKIAQKILDEKWYDFIENYWFAEKYVDIMEKLYLNESYDIAIKLIQHAFTPILSEPTPNYSIFDQVSFYQDVKFPMDSYWFEEILRKLIPKFVKKNHILITHLLITLLDESIKLDNHGKRIDDRYEDGLLVWRSAIEESEQNGSSNIKSAFVTNVRNCLLYIGNNHPKTLKNIMSMIYEKNYWIFRRFELYMYAKFPEIFQSEINTAILWYFDNSDTHHEYYNLINSAFVKLPSYIQQEIYNKIDEGFDSEKFEQIKSEYGEEIAQKREKYWKLINLEAIKEDLDEQHSSLYQKLVSELGEPEHPEYRFYHGVTMVQPSSEPMLFENKSVDQVFEEIKKYTIPENSFPFEDKIINTFREYVENNPLECSKKSFELKDTDSSILYELFSGLKNAVQNNKNIDWEKILPLFHELVILIDTKTSYVSTPYDYLPEIYSLIEEGLKKDAINFQLQKKIWDILCILVSIGNKLKESSEEYPNSSDDALTMSINNINGKSFHVIYQYAIWYEKHSEKKRFLVPEVKEIFNDYLEQKLGGHTISRHAVLGLNFPNFYYLDSGWVPTILEKIISSKNTKIAFWEGYVIWNKLYRYTFKDLYKWYDEFLNKDLVNNLKRMQSYESTINHSILAYFYDLDNADKPFEKFLNTADNTAIAHCVFQIGTILNGKDTDPKFNREKLIKLWSNQSIQQHSLERWFKNSPLDKENTISLYLESLRKYSGKFNFVRMTLDTLIEYSIEFPKSVAECLEILIDKQENNYFHNDVKLILESLIKTRNDSATEICKRIIEKLAILGQDYRKLLNIEK